MRIGWASWGSVMRRMAHGAPPKLREKLWQWRAYRVRKALLTERIKLWRESRPPRPKSTRRALWGTLTILSSLFFLHWALRPHTRAFQISEELRPPSASDAAPPLDLF